MIKTIIFDLGGPLIHHPSKKMNEYFARYLKTDKKILHLATKRYHSDFQKAKITETIFWKNVCSQINIAEPTIKSLWGKAFEYARRPRKRVLKIVEKLYKSGYKTALISDTELPVVKLFRKENYNFFDFTLFSCVERTRKAEGTAIFIKALKKLRVKGREAIFIDDREENIEMAKKLKINTIHFKNYGQLIKKLKSLGIKL